MSHGRLLVSEGSCRHRAGILAALAVLLGMLFGPVASSRAAAPACGSTTESGANTVVTCSYTGALQSFTVPAGVSTVSIDVQGAAGGNSATGSGAAGGDEGGPLTVTSGEVLTILAGGQGGAASVGAGGAGGYGGGAAGGTGTSGGGGGGGGTFVYDGTDALVLAAGGGGGAGSGVCSSSPLAGPGGGATGGQSTCIDSGSGGTQTSGGSPPDITGTSGSGPATWTSGAPAPGSGSPGYSQAIAGGGGGGGYYGGAGGSDAGGGGGSGYCGASVSSCYATTAGGSTADGAVTITYATPVAPTITSGSAATFTTGQPGTFSVTTTGVPTAVISGTGSLPNGVTFTDNGNGTATLSGTPASGTGGSYPITITASNGVSPDATQSFTLTVDQSPAITSGDQATFTTGQPGTFSVSTSGFPKAALLASGSLPSGVSFTDNKDGTATLSGTPASGTGGSYPITITASNGVSPDATQSFTLNVDQPPAITSSDHTAFNAGQAGSFSVSTTGFPKPALSESGSLPSGVKFTDNGDGSATLSGAPAAAAAGSYPITITAHNSASPDAEQTFTLKVQAALASIQSPSSGGVYTLGEVVFVSFTCGADGSGLGSCVDSNGDTDRLDTSSLGPHTFTVTATSLDGQSGSASIHYTVVAPAAPTPALSALRISPTRFAAAGHGGPIIQSGKRGTKVTYQDSVAARTTFRVYRRKAGGGPLVLVGSFTRSDTAGRNSFRFSGRVRGRALRVGHYRLKAVASLGGAASPPATLRFVVLP